MSRFLAKPETGFGVAIALTVLTAASTYADLPPQARVDEIAAMLGAQPAGLGRPCTDRKVWEKLAKQKAYQAVVTDAEKLLDEPLPDQLDDLFLDYSRTGNRRRWERVACERRNRVKTLVIAECVENKGRFIPAFEELVRTLCAEPTWVYPAHDAELRNFHGKQIDIDLFSSELGGELALAHHLLGNNLGINTRLLIEKKVRSRVLDPFHAMVRGDRRANWWLTCTNNWNSVCLAGVTAAAVSLVQDRGERAVFIAAAEQLSKNFLRGLTPDGYCSEGLGYWNYGFGRYAMLAETVLQATNGKLDLMRVGAAQQPTFFGDRVEIVGGVYPMFADCPINKKPDRTLMQYLDRRMGRVRPAEKASRVDPRQGNLLQVLAFTPWNSTSNAVRLPDNADDSPLRTWFKDAGVLICRPAYGTSGRFGVALKGGHNDEHHNHNDVGSYIVVVHNRPVLVDPGSEVYTARTFSSRRYESNVLNSFGHAVPVVAGQLQRVGAEARGRVLKTDFTEVRDSFALDLSSVYDVPTLRRLERDFSYERGDAERLIVMDTVEFAELELFEVALMTFGAWSQVAPDRLCVEYRGRAVDVEIATEGLEFSVTAQEIDEDVGSLTPTRIAIRLAEPVRTARVALRITPAEDEQKP